MTTAADSELEVLVDQDECTGDGLCAQVAPEIFELDIDGLAYVKAVDGSLLSEAGATTRVPLTLLTEVREAVGECPGDCIHVRRVSDQTYVMGPRADDVDELGTSA